MPNVAVDNDLKADALNEIHTIAAIHDTEHNILWANRAYLKATGLPLQEIQGRKCHAVWRLSKPCLGCPVVMATKDGEPHEAKLTPQNQDHWPITQGSWLTMAAPLKDAEGRVIAVIELAYDITAKEKADEQLRERTQELEKANAELAYFNKAMVGRELRMIELKKEIDKLCRQFGQPTRYGYQTD